MRNKAELKPLIIYIKVVLKIYSDTSWYCCLITDYSVHQINTVYSKSLVC